MRVYWACALVCLCACLCDPLLCPAQDVFMFAGRGDPAACLKSVDRVTGALARALAEAGVPHVATVGGGSGGGLAAAAAAVQAARVAASAEAEHDALRHAKAIKRLREGGVARAEGGGGVAGGAGGGGAGAYATGGHGGAPATAPQ